MAFHLNFLHLCKKPPSYISVTHKFLFPLANNGQNWCQKLCTFFSPLLILQGECVKYNRKCFINLWNKQSKFRFMIHREDCNFWWHNSTFIASTILYAWCGLLSCEVLLTIGFLVPGHTLSLIEIGNSSHIDCRVKITLIYILQTFSEIFFFLS